MLKPRRSLLVWNQLTFYDICTIYCFVSSCDPSYWTVPVPRRLQPGIASTKDFHHSLSWTSFLLYLTFITLMSSSTLLSRLFRKLSTFLLPPGLPTYIFLQYFLPSFSLHVKSTESLSVNDLSCSMCFLFVLLSYSTETINLR